MSESTDDAQRGAIPEGVAEPGQAAPAKVSSPSSHDADDVEVVAQSVPEEAPPAPRHDSVSPTSRKLAPPPKPKRDSSNPGSLPPSSGDGLSSAGSLRAPPAPSISYHDAGAASEDVVASALSGSDSLRTIGEALAKDAGAFSASETPTGSRPPVPRPRSQPSISPGEEPETVDAPASSAPPKSSAIFAQRIIAIGSSSASSKAAAVVAPARSEVDLDRTLESEERPLPASPVAEHVQTAQPPLVALVSSPAPASSPPDAATAAMIPPPISTAPPFELPKVAEPDVSVDVHVDDGPGTDIPITTDYDEEHPTAPQASEGPVLPGSTLAALNANEELSLAVAHTSEDAAARAEPLAADDVSPDSAERLPVEELSREDSPSIPPEGPAPVAPPPVPAREAKPPPPPRRAISPAREELASPEAEKKKASKQKRPWWEELFSEDFVRASWKVSDEQIKREVTFVEESLGVAPGGVVLDLGCGSGQHAVELASRGYGVVGYDLSLYQLALAADIAQERSQKINFLQGDMREMAFEEMFDGIFCWNTSFGYFEEDKNFSVAERAFRALRPGGMLLVDVMNRDFVAAHTPSSVWFEGDSCVCMDDAVIDYFTSRLRVKRSIILDDGRTRECTYSVRLYSFHELGKLLHEVGFRVTEVSGHPATPGVFLGQASPRILMLAQRP